MVNNTLTPACNSEGICCVARKEDPIRHLIKDWSIVKDSYNKPISWNHIAFPLIVALMFFVLDAYRTNSDPKVIGLCHSPRCWTWCWCSCNAYPRQSSHLSLGRSQDPRNHASYGAFPPTNQPSPREVARADGNTSCTGCVNKPLPWLFNATLWEQTSQATLLLHTTLSCLECVRCVHLCNKVV